MGTCHCSRCRKVGASTIVFINKDDLVWIQGKENVKLYQPTAPYKYRRCFCQTCGTSLGEILLCDNDDDDQDTFPINAHAIDTEIPQLQNQFHEFVQEKPWWYKICDNNDDAKQYDGHPE